MLISYAPVLDKMIENGNVLNSTVHQNTVGNSVFLDGVITVVKSIISFIAEQGTSLDPVFSIVAIIGVFLIMADFRGIGTKLTSASIFGYLTCKVVDLLC